MLITQSPSTLITYKVGHQSKLTSFLPQFFINTIRIYWFKPISDNKNRHIKEKLKNQETFSIFMKFPQKSWKEIMIINNKQFFKKRNLWSPQIMVSLINYWQWIRPTLYHITENLIFWRERSLNCCFKTFDDKRDLILSDLKLGKKK